MNVPPKPSWFGLDSTLATFTRVLKAVVVTAENAAIARYLTFAGSSPRSSQLTAGRAPDREIHGKNWSCVSVEAATGIGELHVVPPSVDVCTWTFMNDPVHV